jgi:ABC-type oligopeptide transport system substrate-binding subunit
MKKFLCGLLTALTCLMLVACAPSNLEKAEEKLEAAGYAVKSYDIDAEGYVGGVVATKGGSLGNIVGGLLDGNMFTATLFETKEAATKYFNELNEDTKAVQDGKWVYWGSEEAVKAFLK